MTDSASNPLYREYLDAAIPIARAAGDMLARELDNPHTVELKGAINLVTEMDKRSEDMIMAALTKAFPDFTLRAEEGSIHEAKERFVWYIDPLDATTNYAHRLPVFCVTMGLAEDDIPICGVTYNPMGNELFTAVKGEGAWLGERRLKISDTKELTNALLATGFPYDIRESEYDNLDHFARFAKKARAIRRMGSAALDLAWTAAGRFDGFWEMKLSPWDCIAGALMCQEAGGITTDYSGNPFNPLKGQVIAANPTLHPQIAAIVAQGRFER